MPTTTTTTRTRTSPRIRIENVRPQVDCGRFPAKCTAGDRVEVSADVFRDGHEVLGAAVRFRAPGERRWSTVPLEPLGNDRFAGSFEANALGIWELEVEAWSDRAATWRDELRRKLEAGQADVSSELAEGAHLLGVDRLDVETALASTAEDRHDVTRSGRLALDVDPVL